jgi:hypothetical protein
VFPALDGEFNIGQYRRHDRYKQSDENPEAKTTIEKSNQLLLL